MPGKAASSLTPAWSTNSGILETGTERSCFTFVNCASGMVSRIPEFIDRANRSLAARFGDIDIFCFGHVGDGNLHYNVGTEALVPRRDEVNRIVYDTLDDFGGSISAEHGLGQLKREEIRRHKSALELELMHALKRTLDPLGLMNPGKLL